MILLSNSAIHLNYLLTKITEDENNIEYPFEYHELGNEDTEEIKEHFNRHVLTKLIRLGPSGYFFYKEFSKTAVDVYNMPLRGSDIFVTSFPRSGTTWTQELVWLLQNDLNFEKAREIPLRMRFPFLESVGFSKMKFPVDRTQFQEKLSCVDVEMISKLPSPRFIKSHMPLSLLPPSLLETTKVVYVAREPRDVAVSNYLQLKFNQFIVPEGEFKVFWKLFMQGKIRWAPYFEHIKEAWRQRNHPNMTFIFYEELNKDLPAVARRLASFFGKEYSDDQFKALCEYLYFHNFQNNKSVNMEHSEIDKGSFIRKGKVGGWREHFDAEMSAQAERWIADNLRDTDLCFPTA